MRRILFSGVSLILAGGLLAQQKEGKVTYERTTQAQMTLAMNGAAPTTQNITRTNRFELNFANGKSSWHQLEDEMGDDGLSGITGGGGNMIVRSIGPGADDVTFCDFSQSRLVEQRSYIDKQFLIIDSIKKTGTWKLTEETKTILNHLCRKAVSERMGKRNMMTMENGQMIRKEVDDTISVIAWFTTDIPVAIGPETYGQLPGLVLELEMNRGRTIYKALEISQKPSLSAIKEPTKGKKVTRVEYAEETKKLMDEMQKNGGMRFRAG
ncbi:GLPGLI family protein [Terrimonas sp. NA20]|uniref:GLPGLI family protein n=1 Tax=Terrimonas ginsenosidimutans TaxID=2908004 RepID=A0ABS9KKW1_9BACT|nr:GLPGLI family protein [Terrimonas ginsenosidimutans]MCG2612961.1 GLPGLI family protein [Terrimonas ginsenosidimutans]